MSLLSFLLVFTGIFFFTLALFGFSCLSSLGLFANERILFMKERCVNVEYFFSIHPLIPIQSERILFITHVFFVQGRFKWPTSEWPFSHSILVLDPFWYTTPASRTSVRVWWDRLWFGRTSTYCGRILEVHSNTCSFQSDHCECGTMAFDCICERQRCKFSWHVDHAIQVCGFFYPFIWMDVTNLSSSWK